MEQEEKHVYPEGFNPNEHTHAKVYAVYTGMIDPTEDAHRQYEDNGEHRVLHVMAGSTQDIMDGMELEDGEYIMGVVLVANMNANFMSGDRWFGRKKD